MTNSFLYLDFLNYALLLQHYLFAQEIAVFYFLPASSFHFNIFSFILLLLFC